MIKKYKLPLTLSLLALLSLGVFFYTKAQGGGQTTHSPNLQRGLVGHWTLSQEDYIQASNQVKDLSPYGNHGTNFGASFTQDKMGSDNGAMSFNGSNYILIPNPINQENLEQEWSVSAWVNISDNNNQQLFRDGEFNRGLHLNFSSTNRMLLYLNSGDQDYYVYSDQTNLLANQGWKHVVFIFRNSDAYRKIFVDTNDNSGTGPNKNSTPRGISPTIRIGNGVVGSISDIRVYNRIISQEEIDLLYNSHKPQFQGSSLDSGLIGHWTMSETDYDMSNNRIKDLSPFENHGLNNKGLFVNNRFVDTSSALQFNENQEDLLMDYRIWKDGQVGVVGQFSVYEGNGNKRIIAEDPWGRDVVVWSSGQGATNWPSAGGIYHNPQSIDNTKLYRMSWWEKRVTNANGTYGRYYAGLNGYGSTNGVLNLNTGTFNTNPYFWYVGHDALVEGQWFLVVGHVFPHTHSGTSRHPDSGRYTVEDGFIGHTSVDFKWSEVTTSARSRTLAIYRGNDENMLHYTVYPRLDIVDGSEPSIQDLLNGYDSYGGDLFVDINDNPVSISLWYKKDGEDHWLHVVKSDNNYYINAELGVPDIFPAVVNSNKLYIGRTSMSDYFDGQIDDVRVYNRALSQQEIVQLYETNKPQVQISSLHRGLVLDMPLNSSSYNENTNRVDDRSVYGNHGVNNNGIFNNNFAYFSQNSSDFLSIPHNENINFGSDDSFTVSASFSLDEHNGGERWSILMKGSGLNSYGISGRWQALNVGYRSGLSSIVALSYPIELQTQYHVVMVVDNTENIMKLYVDGQFINSRAINFDVVNSSNWTSFSTNGIAGSAGLAGGKIKNLKIYNRALTDNEVSLLYHLDK